MSERALAFPKGYDHKQQRTVALFAAQLDDQLGLLKEAISGLTVAQFEWQPHKGMNTIGMLLAHLAIVEVFWINLAAEEVQMQPDGEKIMKEKIGITSDDDGMPLAPEGKHPEILKGKTHDDYVKMLDGARVTVHSALQGWNDTDLDKTFKRREWSISRMWTLYHVLEHFACHFGQILVLKHMMRDAGILTKEKE